MKKEISDFRRKREKRNARILKLYFEDKLSMEQVARRVSTDKTSVYRILKRSGRKDRHWGEKNRMKREEALRAAHDRIIAKESDIYAEAKKLRIVPETLKVHFRHRGMKLPQRQSRLHGTRYRYMKGCRCDQCRRAAVEYQYNFWGREPPIHGTRNAYTNYGCRCEECKAAGREINRMYYERRKREARV